MASKRNSRSLSSSSWTQNFNVAHFPLVTRQGCTVLVLHHVFGLQFLGDYRSMTWHVQRPLYTRSLPSMTGLTLHCILILRETRRVYAVISSICTFNTGFGIDRDATSEFRQFLNNSINVGSGGLRSPRFTCIIDRPHRCPVIDLYLVLSRASVGELHIPNIYSIQ